MAIFRISGKPNVEPYPKTASTVLHNGQPVKLTSGKLVPSAATDLKNTGVIMKSVLATDGDYALTPMVPVDVPAPNDIFEADVKPGVTALISHVGVQCDLYVSANESYVDPTSTSHGQFVVVGFVSASKLLVKFNGLMSLAAAS